MDTYFKKIINQIYTQNYLDGLDLINLMKYLLIPDRIVLDIGSYKGSEAWLMDEFIKAGESAVPCTCNPLQQGWYPETRVGLVWSAVCISVLRNGSCAIGGCEPCQVGNQAALSSLVVVPQGCLF